MPSAPRADPLTVAALGVAVLAVSASAPTIAYAAAPALAIAFWRNALAAAVVVPVAVVGRRDELRDLAGPDRRAGWYTVLAGGALAVHFGTWVPSTKLTTVATATALVATQPVWQGLIAVVQGRRLSALTWLGIVVAVAGAVVVTGADALAGPDAATGTALVGDLLAVAGAIAAAGYTALGARVRATASTTSYTAICYLVCALVLLPVCLVAGAPLGGYPATAWIALVGLTVGPQLLGHSLFNFALRRVAATTVSVVILLEVPGAALIGWVWLGQAPDAAAWVGIAVLMAGVLAVVLGGRPRLAGRVSPGRD